MNLFPFKSYCWCIGTTSFRASHLNFKIERQLQLLGDFWTTLTDDERNEDNQAKYYYYLKSNGFLSGEAGNPAKDAREKTSPMAQLGLVDSERKITPVGDLIRNMTETGRNRDNLFSIDSDSYIYLLQFLKLTITNDGFNVKPFIVLLYLLEKLDNLTVDEFTYLLPLCKTNRDAIDLVNYISENRNNNTDEYVYTYLEKRILSMENYRAALQYFLTQTELNQETFINIGMNRKSTKYDGNFYHIYVALKKLIFWEQGLNNEKKEIYNNLFNAIKTISPNAGSQRKAYFKCPRNGKVDNEYDSFFRSLKICRATTVEDFKKEFFVILHTLKRKSTLEDYADLNRRYFSLTDIIQYNDSIVELDLLPKYYFKDIVDSLLNEDNLNLSTYIENLKSFKNINEISTIYPIDSREAVIRINNDTGESLTTETIPNYITNQRLNKFKQLISRKFGDDTLLDLITNIEERNDSYVQNIIGTDNADVPTIFEYVVGIIWYKISNEEGNILDFMNLSLDANLLPKTHAGGGQADIEYEYNESNGYPRHDLLLEVTLSESTGQRSMEMEPVQRHLGEHRLRTQNTNDYSIFIATNLQENLIFSFRNMRNQIYGTSENYIDGLKIIPINTEILKQLMIKNLKYDAIYHLFDEAFNSGTHDTQRFNNEILEKINNL